jgi:hypothetical protein
VPLNKLQQGPDGSCVRVHRGDVIAARRCEESHPDGAQQRRH